MIVLIDIGNTRVKLGWLDPATGQREHAAFALPHSELDEIPAWLSRLSQPPTLTLGACVASPAVAQAWSAQLARHGAAPAQWITPASRAAGLGNDYDHPERLGPDRWAALLGMLDIVEGAGTADRPALLATFGTATTVDTIGPGPQGPAFMGGVILPGPSVMLEAAASSTARLPRAEGDIVDFPTNTHPAVFSGIAAAQAGALLRQWREGLERYGQAPRVYVSGGGWPMVEREVQRVVQRAQSDLGVPVEAAHYVDRPVLDGLARIARWG